MIIEAKKEDGEEMIIKANKEEENKEEDRQKHGEEKKIEASKEGGEEIRLEVKVNGNEKNRQKASFKFLEFLSLKNLIITINLDKEKLMEEIDKTIVINLTGLIKVGKIQVNQLVNLLQEVLELEDKIMMMIQIYLEKDGVLQTIRIEKVIVAK
jgi:hypothetical protein